MTSVLLRLMMSAAVLLATGCAATLSVGAHRDRSIDLTRFRTFNWGPADALPAGDPRLDRDPTFQDRVQGAVERGLVARGLELSAGSPDLLIHYHINVSDRVDVNRADRLRGYCDETTCPPEVIHFEAGTLVLDVVDRRSNQVVWRGWAQNRADDLLGNRDRMAATIDKAVATMLRQLPPMR